MFKIDRDNNVTNYFCTILVEKLLLNRKLKTEIVREQQSKVTEEYMSDFIKADFHFTYNEELHIYKYKHIFITISSYQHHTW